MKWTKLNSIKNQIMYSESGNFYYWKIEDGFVWHQKRKLRKADPESFEIREDPNNTFIARDKNHVYHAWSLMKNIDRDTFKEVDNGYWVDKNNAYCEHETSIKPLKGNDAKNFKFIGGPYARDSKFAYYGGRAMKSCLSPLKLQLVTNDDCWFVGDGSKVFYDGSEIKGAKFQSWEKITGGFSKDETSVFFGNKKLPSVKVASWKIIEGNFSCDEKNVYSMCYKLKNADSKSWALLKHDYSKDSSNVYCGTHIINEADNETFVVLGYQSAKDKNHTYNGTQIVKA